MAEKPEDQINVEEKIVKGKELYARGCRNYYVKRYSEAADDLSDACKFYADAYGVDGDELGDAYLLYAKALVAVGQEENKLIEVPENEEEDEPAEEDDGEAEENGDDDEKMEADENEEEDKPEEAEAATEKTNGSDEQLPGPSTSSGEGAAASTAADAENGDSNDTDEGNVEDDGGNLEVAWEVLQNAVLIFQRQEDKGLSKLLDCYSEMANISIENSNFEIALDDLNRARNIFDLLDDQKDRILADIYYRIGLCQTMIKQYDEAMKSFQKSSDIFTKMIDDEKAKEQTEETVAKIKDLEETQQEILNKVMETGDVKAEEIERVKSELAKLYGINGAAGSSSTDGSGPSGSGSSGTVKIVEKSPETNKPKPTDISHLIKRKKPDSDTIECSPAKKPSIEITITSSGSKNAVPIDNNDEKKVLEECPTVQVSVAAESGEV